MRVSAIIICTVFAVVSAENKGNVLVDKVLASAKAKMAEKNWCTSKNMAKESTTLPLTAADGSAVAATMTITDATIKGLCTITRAGHASLDETNKELSGSLRMNNIIVDVTVQISNPGKGEMPGEEYTGNAKVEIKYIKGSFTASTDTTTNDPITLDTFDVTTGGYKVSTSDLLNSSNMYAKMDLYAIKTGLKDLAVNTINRNVKAQVRSAILNDVYTV